MPCYEVCQYVTSSWPVQGTQYAVPMQTKSQTEHHKTHHWTRHLFHFILFKFLPCPSIGHYSRWLTTLQHELEFSNNLIKTTKKREPEL